MRLACQLWFWLAIANVFVTYGLLTFGDYPRQKRAVDRWQDALSVVVSACIAIYLYMVIWRA